MLPRRFVSLWWLMLWGTSTHPPTSALPARSDEGERERDRPVVVAVVAAPGALSTRSAFMGLLVLLGCSLLLLGKCACSAMMYDLMFSGFY